jgi:hypothetical protein
MWCYESLERKISNGVDGGGVKNEKRKKMKVSRILSALVMRL